MTIESILDFAGEAGLVVILHNDVDMPFPKAGQEPYMVVQLRELLVKHPDTTVIWAHGGLGRVPWEQADLLGVGEQDDQGAVGRAPGVEGAHGLQVARLRRDDGQAWRQFHAA